VADSLQDQLRALGLAKEQKRKDRKKAPPGQKGAGRRHAPGGGRGRKDAELPLDKAWALRAREEKRSAAEARARKQEEDRKRREINKAVRAVVEPNRLNRDDAEVARNFMFRGRIRKVYVTPEQHKSLGEGRLGLVYLSGGYHLLAPEQVEAVRKIDASHVIDLGGDEPEDEEIPVPDDLLW
jgi:uncharacterized protein YaiL (DUF2058 family)